TMLRAELGNPRRFLARIEAPLRFRGQLLEDQPRVADNADVGGAIVTDLASVEIDVDELRRRRKARRAQERQHRVGARADYQDRVGLAERRRTRRRKRPRMILGDNAATLRRG